MTENQYPAPPAPVPANDHAGAAAPTKARRVHTLVPALAAAGLAVFLVGGATGAAIAPTPEPVTHTQFKEVEVEVEVPVTPVACADAIDQIFEFRLLAMEMMTAAIDSDIAEMTSISDDMGMLNLRMESTQQRCLGAAPATS